MCLTCLTFWSKSFLNMKRKEPAFCFHGSLGMLSWCFSHPGLWVSLRACSSLSESKAAINHINQLCTTQRSQKRETWYQITHVSGVPCSKWMILCRWRQTGRPVSEEVLFFSFSFFNFVHLLSSSQVRHHQETGGLSRASNFGWWSLPCSVFCIHGTPQRKQDKAQDLCWEGPWASLLFCFRLARKSLNVCLLCFPRKWNIHLKRSSV